MAMASHRTVLLAVALGMLLALALPAHAPAANRDILTQLESWANQEQDPQRQAQIRGVARMLAGNDKRKVIAENLLEVKEGRMSAQDFYVSLAKNGGSMFDVMAVKRDITNAGGDVMKGHFLGDLYSAGGSKVEAKLLTWRRQVVMDLIKKVVAKNAQANPKFTVFYSPVGSWPKESVEAMKVAGDIDFSWVSADSNLIKQLKADFDVELTALFRQLSGDPHLDFGPIQFDTVATAHGHATPDVYVSQHGKIYGDQSMEGAKMQEVDLKKGSISDQVTPGKQALNQVAVEDKLAAHRVPDSTTFKHHTEPGLSMEMARHMEHDIIRPNLFDPVDSFLKGAKYLLRSNDALKGDLGLDPSNPALDKFVRDLLAAKNKGPKAQVEIIKAYFGSLSLFGTKMIPGATGPNRFQLFFNQQVVGSFWQDCMKGIWDNAARGLDFKLKDLSLRMKNMEGMPPDAKVAEAIEIYKNLYYLKKMLADEIKVFKDSGQLHEIPAAFTKLQKQFQLDFDSFKKILNPMVLGNEGLKDIEYIKQSEAAASKGAKHALDQAVGFVARRTIQFAEMGVEGAMKINAMLDILDDTLMGELRGEKDFSEFLATARAQAFVKVDANKVLGTNAGALQRFKMKATQTISRVELKLNNMLLNNCAARGLRKVNIVSNQIITSTSGGRAALKAMVVFNLYNEATAYRDAWAKGGWNELATEFFRRRVPFGSALEHAIMGNVGLALWDCTTTLLPPLALGQAAVTLMGQAMNWSQKLYYSTELQLFIDELYNKATFKMEKVTKIDELRLAEWRCVKLEYHGSDVDVEAFAKKSRKNLKEWEASLKKGLDQRSYPLNTWGLTGNWDERWLLKQNLAKTDPVLVMLDGMIKDPIVGPRLKSHYQDAYEARWQRVKLSFILKTINDLEDRRAAEWALIANLVPAMYQKLMETTRELEISEAVANNIDKDVDTSYMKRFFEWLVDLKRAYYSQGSLEDSYERAAKVIKRYLTLYTTILKARTRAEELFAMGQPVEDGLRILTSQLFLTGQAGQDETGYTKWAEYPVLQWNEIRVILGAIKEKCVPGAKLDTAYDKEMLDKILSHTVWARLWRHVFSEAQSLQNKVVQGFYVRESALAADLAQPQKMMDKAKKHFKEHAEAKKKLLGEFETHYCQAAAITVHVKQMVKDQKTDLPVTNAEVTASGPPAGSGAKTLEQRLPGQYALTEGEAGSWVVKVKAPGHKTPDGKDQAKVGVVLAKGPDQKIVPVETTVYLVPIGLPQLKLEFTSATASDPPKLKATVSSENLVLDPTSWKLAAGPLSLLGEVKVLDQGKTLTSLYKFTAPVPPGLVKASGTVSDDAGNKAALAGEFTYNIPLELTGYKVDDTGGSPADGKAQSGEKIKLAVKVRGLEPWPRGALTLTIGAEDPLLKATGEKKWTIASLPARQEATSGSLPFEVGQVTGDQAQATMPLSVTLEGQPLPQVLDLTVTLYSPLALTAELVPPLSDPKVTGSANNGDGKANPGESISLTLKISNPSDQPSPAYTLNLSCPDGKLALGQSSFSGQPLAGQASQEFKLTAQVDPGLKQATTTSIRVEIVPAGQTAGKPINLPLDIELAPLDIKLLKVVVEDPATGSLVNINDGNGKLGSGEHGYLTLTLVNQGPDIQEAYIKCNGPNIGGFSVDQSQSQTGSKPMPQNQPVSSRFQVRVPVDWMNPTATLTIKVHDAASGRSWETTHALEIEAKSDLSSDFQLKGAAGPAKPEEIAPGAKLPFELTVTNTSTKPLQDMAMGLRYSGVSIVPPLWTGLSFAPGAKQTYKGTLSIPATFTQPGFEVALDVTTGSGSRTVHKNKWAFKIGVKDTQVKLTPTAPAAGAGAWKVAVEVTTADGQPVDAGEVKLSADQGSLSADTLTLASGKGSFSWTPPGSLNGQATIKANYLGDVADPGQPDKKYRPSSAELKLPPAAKPTKVKVTAAPVKAGDASRFTITVEVTDDQGRPVNKGALEITCDLGAISGAGIGTTGGTVKLTGAPIKLSWTAPAAQGQTGKAVFSYTGDQTDPAKPDAELAPSSTTLDLPPDALALPVLTVSKALIDRDKGLWRIEVSLTDDKGRPLSPARVNFTATGGSFGAGAVVLNATTDLAGGKCEKGWIKTDDQQHTVTVTYPGDKSGPGGTNAKYQEVSETLKLPPEMVERSTVFVVDASGSMGGGKLRSAKAAVRAALAGYAPGQGKEEWALIVFAGCGNISVRQPFTTNPNDITSRLGFGAGGGTPIAAAMSKAGRYIRAYGQGKSGRVILLSDGGESCRGDPVKAADSIRRSVRSVTPGGGTRP